MLGVLRTAPGGRDDVDLQERLRARTDPVRDDVPVDDRVHGRQDAATERDRVDAWKRALLRRDYGLRDRGMGRVQGVLVVGNTRSLLSGVVGLAAVVPFVVGQSQLDVGFGDLGVQINLWMHIVGSAAVIAIVFLPAAHDWVTRWL